LTLELVPKEPGRVEGCQDHVSLGEIISLVGF